MSVSALPSWSRARMLKSRIKNRGVLLHDDARRAPPGLAEAVHQAATRFEQAMGNQQPRLPRGCQTAICRQEKGLPNLQGGPLLCGGWM